MCENDKRVAGPLWNMFLAAGWRSQNTLIAAAGNFMNVISFISNDAAKTEPEEKQMKKKMPAQVEF